ncbi:MAG: succinylglutamate desuccinylase/aspartoacylase family protein, partial [bacterium]
MKTIKAKIIGHGHPKIAILGCVHGDEIMGAKAIRELLKLPIVKGELHFIIANEPAKQKRQRYLKHDLNRAFPGNPDGEAEHYLAHVLKQQLAKMDLVIDLHATNSNFSDLAIITKLGQKEKQLLKLIPNQKVALIRKAVFGGNDLISHTKLGLALEYGPNKTGKNYPQAVRD